MIFPFIETTLVPFSFQPTLDGQTYGASVPWSLFGRRYYLQLNDRNGVLVLYTALIGSPIGVDIQSVTWAVGTVTVLTAAPHGYAIGETVELTLTGCIPVEYNGIVEATITSEFTFTYPLAANPGDISTPGHVDYNINLVKGYFTNSTLVYRQSNAQFIVTP